MMKDFFSGFSYSNGIWVEATEPQAPKSRKQGARRNFTLFEFLPRLHKAIVDHSADDRPLVELDGLDQASCLDKARQISNFISKARPYMSVCYPVIPVHKNVVVLAVEFHFDDSQNVGDPESLILSGYLPIIRLNNGEVSLLTEAGKENRLFFRGGVSLSWREKGETEFKEMAVIPGVWESLEFLSLREKFHHTLLMRKLFLAWKRSTLIEGSFE